VFLLECELSFLAGDKIKVLKSDGEWCYGLLNGTKGWFPPSYGEIVFEEEDEGTVSTSGESDVSDIYSGLSEDQKKMVRDQTINDFLKAEEMYYTRLQNFQRYIVQLQSISTPWVASLLGQGSVKTIFRFFGDILSATEG